LIDKQGTSEENLEYLLQRESEFFARVSVSVRGKIVHVDKDAQDPVLMVLAQLGHLKPTDFNDWATAKVLRGKSGEGVAAEAHLQGARGFGARGKPALVHQDKQTKDKIAVVTARVGAKQSVGQDPCKYGADCKFSHEKPNTFLGAEVLRLTNKQLAGKWDTSQKAAFEKWVGEKCRKG